MKKLVPVIAVAAAVLTSGPANAALSEPAAPSFDFSGLYGGFGLGAVSTTSSLDGAGINVDGIGMSGFAYGAQAGFGFPLGGSPWIAGAELGIGSNTGEYKSSIPAISWSGKVTQNYSFTADARLGRTFGETLLYGKLGYAYADFDTSVGGLGFNGLRVGGGAETRLAGSLTGRVEAIYTAYDSGTKGGIKYEPSSVGMMFGLNYYLQ